MKSKAPEQQDGPLLTAKSAYVLLGSLVKVHVLQSKMMLLDFSGVKAAISCCSWWRWGHSRGGRAWSDH